MRPNALAIALLGTCACLALGLLAPGRAPAAPLIKVKARTDLRLLPVMRSQETGAVVVRGGLVYQHTEEPVPGELVEVTMDGQTRTSRTDENGEFEAEFDVDDGQHDVAAVYQGGTHAASSQSERDAVAVGKQNIELSVTTGEVSYSKEIVDVTIRATLQGTGVSISANLYAGSTEAPSLIGRVTTNAGGIGTYPLERSVLGSPGRKRILVKFAGDPAFNPTEALLDFELATDTRTTLTLATSSMSFEADVMATGRVTDETGAGIAEAPVTLRAGARRLASALTEKDGSFELEVEGSDLGPGTSLIQAVFEPSQSWQRGSRSDVFRVQVAEPQPVPITHTLAAFGATAMAMVAFLGLRTRPWQGWLARLRRARGAGSAAENGPNEPAQPLEGGLRESHAGLISNLRRPQIVDFNGRVLDAATQRPVASAVVTLAHPEGANLSQECDGRGRFHFTDLEAGQWRAQVAAPGYVTERFPVGIPHRGELRGARVDLVPVRERIFSMYREIAEPLLPEADKWGIWTPRQIFDYVRAQFPAPALSALTDFVEETYFSQRTPHESILGDAERHVLIARTEMAARSAHA